MSETLSLEVQEEACATKFTIFLHQLSKFGQFFDEVFYLQIVQTRIESDQSME